MSISKRIANLFKADVHEILDRIEEPEAVIRQGLREMEEEIERESTELQSAETKLRLLQHDLALSASDLAALSDQLKLCLDASNDDLARAVLKKKLSAEKESRVKARIAETLEAQVKSAGATLAEKKERLRAVREKAEILCRSGQSSTTAGARCNAITDEDIEIALLEEKRRRAESSRPEKQEI